MSSSIRTPRGGRIKGNSTVTIEVKGVSAIQRALRPLLEPKFSLQIDASNKKAAQALAKDVRSEARPASKRMAKAVRVKRARTGKPGWVVGSKRKTAFFWHMVINGTRDHGPKRAKMLVFVTPTGTVRTTRVKGVKANPIVDRVVARRERGVEAQLERDYLKGTGL